MRLFVLVNNPNELESAKTTLKLIQKACLHDHKVLVTGIQDLSVAPDGRILAQATPAAAWRDQSLGMLANEIRITNRHPYAIRGEDVVLMRTNPARDKGHSWAHETSMALMRLARERGTLVVNDPDGLELASSKLYLQYLPESVRPRTLISRNKEEVMAFISSLQGRAVLKPLSGTWGQDVFMVHSDKDKNLLQIMDVLMRQGFAIVQEFVPEAVDGDTRVVVMNGQILEINGRPAAVHRIPGKADFRSNIHAGGRAEPGIITPIIREIVAKVGPRLVNDGIFLAGLDIIGNKIIEINVASTGGIQPAEEFEGADFTGTIIEAIKTRQAARGKGHVGAIPRGGP
ncbi:MAG: glutathione synthase [Ardenticatenaceae bacterium]